MTLAAGALLLASCTPSAFAYLTPIAGSTQGVFTNTGTSVTQGLTFTGSTFSGTLGTPPGSLALNLGNFGLNVCGGLICGSIYNTTMALTVGFTSPAGVSNPSYFAGLGRGLAGRLLFVSGGAVKIDFDNTPQLVQYSIPGGAGSFYLAVNDITVHVGSHNPLTGSITAGTFTHAPEPSSIFLLCTVLGGLGVAMRRRLRARG